MHTKNKNGHLLSLCNGQTVAVLSSVDPAAPIKGKLLEDVYGQNQ